MECKNGKNEKLLIKDFGIQYPEKEVLIKFLNGLINDIENVQSINVEQLFNPFSLHNERNGFDLTIRYTSNKLPKLED